MFRDVSKGGSSFSGSRTWNVSNLSFISTKKPPWPFKIGYLYVPSEFTFKIRILTALYLFCTYMTITVNGDFFTINGDFLKINGDYYNKRRLLQWTVIITVNGDYYNKRRFFTINGDNYNKRRLLQRLTLITMNSDYYNERWLLQ